MPEENIQSVTKPDCNFIPTFVNHDALSEINFNGHCLTNNNICISKKDNKSMYFLHTKSTIKKSKHRFYLKELLPWIRKAN